MKLIFAVLDVSLTMSLTRCYKTEGFFTFINLLAYVVVVVVVTTVIGRVSYLIYVSMRHSVLTTSGDIVVCFHTAVCFSC